LVEAAHARDIAVVLDVVYNHFGPQGNFLSAYAPAFFSDQHRTPWGDAINFDVATGGAVREFFIHNALYWLIEFDLDGLRLDAAHAMMDSSLTHFLDEIAERARARIDRPVHLLLENEDNDVRRLMRKEGAPVLYTAQWNDDVHHGLHVAASGEGAGYYADYIGRTDLLVRSLAEGFAFQGEHMPSRGSVWGAPSTLLPPEAFVAFIQNHDQIGNRGLGERLGMIVPAVAMRALSAVYLLLPQTPMIFMGEEWDARQPFPFFCDFDEELAESVSAGRRAEFARFPEFADPKRRALFPDPQAETTFQSAKLDWDRVNEPHLRRYRALLAVRRREITPLRISRGGEGAVYGAGALQVRWLAGEATLILSANLSGRSIDIPGADGRVLWSEGEAAEPWSVHWILGSTG
jgi:maltooligosyltrehalose trehalohydrolase